MRRGVNLMKQSGFNVRPRVINVYVYVYVNRHRLYSSASFAELRDPAGFGAAWGPRTCERRSPCYNFSTEAQCNWHGSSWPFETSKTLSGLANLLQGMEGTSGYILLSP